MSHENDPREAHRFEPITLADGQVTLVRHGAQILSFRPTGMADHALPDVLWCSPSAIHEPKKAIRGGIPICFPWFGPHPSDPQAPSHGLVRTALWDLVEHTDVSARLELTIEDWSLAVKVAVDVATAALSVELQARYVREISAVVTSHALHTYLSVSNVQDVRIEGLEGKNYIDQLSPADAPKQVQRGALQLTAETDRVYVNAPDPVVLHDVGRIIEIEKTGAASTVIWNPWTEKAKRLADMPDDSWPGMICVEAGNIDQDARTLAPGEAITVGTRIRVIEKP